MWIDPFFTWGVHHRELTRLRKRANLDSVFGATSPGCSSTARELELVSSKIADDSFPFCPTGSFIMVVVVVVVMSFADGCSDILLWGRFSRRS
jgi:hypothetical protein